MLIDGGHGANAPLICPPYETNSRVSGLVRQHAGIDADLAQRAQVFLVDIVAEDQVRIGVAVQPAIVLDLVLELARRPAGIAQRQDRVLRSGALGDRLEDVHRRGQADAVVDIQRRVLDEEIARMQHEAAAGIDRAALLHLHGLGVFRQLDLVGLLDDVELYQQAGKIDAAGRAVDDDAHRPFRGMRAHVDDGALEARIAHHRHGDQQLAVQVTVARRIIAKAGGFAADGLRSFAFRAHPQTALLLLIS